MTSIPHWQLKTPISAVIFDCDGTLSTLEGINVLAKNNGVANEVESLTERAMGESGINASLYQRRLDLVYPRQEQVTSLGQQYFTHQVPDTSAVIQLLQRLNKSIYLVSAGLYPAVRIFGELLQVPRQNIFAVDIQFDPLGNFLDYEKTSPLVHNDGKRHIISQLKSVHPELLYVGDGMNDLSAIDLVTRFVGFGGVFYREKIAARCQYYINTLSMSALLPLCLTQHEYDSLTPEERALYQQGLSAIHEGKVIL